MAALGLSHEGGGARRVAAERDLGRRREPAELPARALAPQERRFGEVTLGRDRFARCVILPFGERHDGFRVAGEGMVGDGNNE
jgi:hypothetical protein